MNSNFQVKIKNKIINELNEGLYLHLNMDLYDADHFFGYYNGYIYKLIDRVYNKHGARGLRLEIKYMIQYLIFLMNKLKHNSKFEDYILVVIYFRIYYKHYSYRQIYNENQLCFNFR